MALPFFASWSRPSPLPDGALARPLSLTPGFSEDDKTVVRKTHASIAAYTYQLINANFPQYDYHGEHASPSEIWIFYDGDDLDSKDPTLQNNDYPDPGDNHGTAGENVAFTDGHVEWVSQKNYLRSWFRGNDETHAPLK